MSNKEWDLKSYNQSYFANNPEESKEWIEGFQEAIKAVEENLLKIKEKEEKQKKEE